MTDKEICESPLRLLVIDVLKPHKPNIVELGRTMCLEGKLDSANITVYAVDEKTESLKIIIEGNNLIFDDIKQIIEDNGGAVHSIDKVIVGNKPQYDPTLPKIQV